MLLILQEKCETGSSEMIKCSRDGSFMFEGTPFESVVGCGLCVRLSKKQDLLLVLDFETYKGAVVKKDLRQFFKSMGRNSR